MKDSNWALHYMLPLFFGGPKKTLKLETKKLKKAEKTLGCGLKSGQKKQNKYHKIH